MRPQCPNCGENLEGDGYNYVIHCPYTEEDYYCLEPDAAPVYCNYPLQEPDTAELDSDEINSDT